MRFLIIPLLIPAALVLAAGASPAGASADNVISPDQTSNMIGECMTVEGQVALRPAQGRLGEDLSFDSGDGFVGYIPAVNALGDLSRFDGQTVDITGVIEPGMPGLTQIQVTSPEQIMLSDETPDRLLTCDRF
jgi:hypothetical protein